MANRPHIPVVYVDDDDAVRELAATYLTDREFRGTGAANGAEMPQALQDHVIELVLLDLRLNGGDGMQLARGLRDSGEILPLLRKIEGDPSSPRFHPDRARGRLRVQHAGRCAGLSGAP